MNSQCFQSVIFEVGGIELQAELLPFSKNGNRVQKAMNSQCFGAGIYEESPLDVEFHYGFQMFSERDLRFPKC